MTDSSIVVGVIPTTGYAVLGLLSFGQALSGYDLKRWADHSLRYFFWSPAQSAIYTELRRLEELGLVRRSGAAGGPRNRQRYRITAAGRRELADWVGSSPTPATVVKDHALVKVWLGHMADRPRLTEVVAAEHDAAEELLDEIRYSLEHAGANRPSHGRAGRALLRADRHRPGRGPRGAPGRPRRHAHRPHAARRAAAGRTAPTTGHLMTRNPHAGEPFTADDATIAAALEDVSAPALLCSLVHMTGDPSWIRGDIVPRYSQSLDVQSGIPAEERADLARRALPVIAAYRDGGCVPQDAVARAPARDDGVPRLSPGHRARGGPLPRRPAVRRGRHGDDRLGRRDPRRRAGRLPGRGHRLRHGRGSSPASASPRPASRSPSSTRTTVPAARGGRTATRGPGSTSGSHQYCYSFEPADHWSEFYCQQPELQDYFASVVEKHGLRPALPLRHPRARRSPGTTTPPAGRCGPRRADGTEDLLEARFVISGVGSLNLPKLPDIEGMDTFAGPSFHSARWPEDLDLTGRARRPRRGRCQRLPDRPGRRRTGRAPDDLPAHRAVDHPESAVPPARARRRPLGPAPPALLRPVVPVPDDVRGHRRRHRALPDRPRPRRPDRPLGQRRPRSSGPMRCAPRWCR